MKMYIANATKQNMDFIYRLPEVKGLRVQTIPIAGQIQITGDLNQIQVDAIIEQHGKYGMIPVEEVDRARAFTGLCYSIDKPVPVAKIMTAVRLNTNVLQERGKQIRLESGLAEHSRIEKQLAEGDIPGELKALNVSVQEERAQPDGEQLSEGVRITRTEPETQRPVAPRRKR